MKLLPHIDWKNVNFVYIAQARRYFVLAILLGVSGIGLFLFLAFIQLPQLIELVNNLNSEKKNLSNIQQKVLALRDGALVDQTDNRQKIDTLLPSKKPLLQLLNNVGSAAQNSQVRLIAIETSPGRIASGSAQLKTNVASFDFGTPEAKINGVDVLTIGLTVNGTLAQINAFVKNIEQITPISDITQLKLTSQSDVLNSTTSYEAKLRVASYYFTQPITVSIDAPLPKITANAQAFLVDLNKFQFTPETEQPAIQGGVNDLFGGQSGLGITQ
jgi:hypothetical protein